MKKLSKIDVIIIEANQLLQKNIMSSLNKHQEFHVTPLKGIKDEFELPNKCSPIVLFDWWSVFKNDWVDTGVFKA